MKIRIFGLALFLTMIGGRPASSAEYYEPYLLRQPAQIDIGVQPLGYPVAMIGAVMARDGVLRDFLKSRSMTLAMHPYRNGVDMVPFVGGDGLEFGFLGDMPTIRAVVTRDVDIVGLAKQTSSSIVSRERTLQQLKGKTIGYVPGSSAHHALLQGLASVGMSDRDVSLVAVPIDDMPDALDAERIAAFAAWEPAPTIATGRNRNNRVAFRAQSTDYFVVSQDFVKRQPEAARAVISAFVRAIYWMKKSTQNAEYAATWALTEGESFSGKPSGLKQRQAVDIAQREILTIPSAPLIPGLAEGKVPLSSAFDFLQRLGKLPENADRSRLDRAFAFKGLQEVLADAKKHRVYRDDYPR